MRQRCRKSFSWLMTASSSCVLPVCRRFLSWWPSRTGCPSSCARWRTQRRRFSELPLNQPKHRADREADWPLLALLHFVDLLQRDGSQRLPLLRRRRRGSTYQKQTETRDLVSRLTAIGNATLSQTFRYPTQLCSAAASLQSKDDSRHGWADELSYSHSVKPQKAVSGMLLHWSEIITSAYTNIHT